MTELDAKTFARGVHDSIRAVQNIYGAVRQMRDEIGIALERAPAPFLYDLGIRAESSIYHPPEEKIVHSWVGRFYNANPAEAAGEAEEDEDIAEGEPDEEESPKGKGPLILTAGEKLAYLKIVLCEPVAEAPEPHLLYGVLHNCHVAGGWQEIEVRRYMLRRVLYVVDAGLTPRELRPNVKAQVPKGVPKPKGKDTSNRLLFDVRHAPERVVLHDIRGPEQVRQIANDLKRLWSA